jgi:hypothetical protein
MEGHQIGSSGHLGCDDEQEDYVKSLEDDGADEGDIAEDDTVTHGIYDDEGNDDGGNDDGGNDGGNDEEELTFAEFSKFFQFHAFDILSERIDDLHGQKDMQYKKFIQMHREMPWARDILKCVSKVLIIKNSYKWLMLDLERRNMHNLRLVCTHIVTSNYVPHRVFDGMQKCIITGKWYKQCLDISKTANQGGLPSHMCEESTEHNKSSQDTGLCTFQDVHYKPSSSASPSASAASFLSGLHISSPVSSSSCVTSSSGTYDTTPHDKWDGASYGKGNGATRAKSQTKRAHNSSRIKNTHNTGRAKVGYNTGPPLSENGIFISCKFQHFVHMLWTVAKLEIVVKNYTLSWFADFLLNNNTSKDPSQQESPNESVESMRACGPGGGLHVTKKELLALFCSESVPFQERLYTIFLHAVSHVHLSLTEYINCSFLQQDCSKTDHASSVNSCCQHLGTQTHTHPFFSAMESLVSSAFNRVEVNKSQDNATVQHEQARRTTAKPCSAEEDMQSMKRVKATHLRQAPHNSKESVAVDSSLL